LYNLANKPLNLENPSLSEASKSFLIESLKSNEDERMEWEQVYKHELFLHIFDTMIPDVKKLEDKAKFIINNLREIVALEKIDMLELF
jgi:serine/threonine protein kinase